MLGDYLKQQDITQTEFAARLGVSQGLVSQWISGATRITPEQAEKIEEATRGDLKKHDLIWPPSAVA